MLITETHALDNSLPTLLERTAGARWFGLPRPDSKEARRAGCTRGAGGIGFLVFNKHLKVRRVNQNHNGALLIEVRAPGCQPCGIIGVYNPPVTSSLNRPDNAFSRALMEDVATMYHEAKRRYDPVLLLGDFNYRLGNLDGLRSSSDTSAANDKRRGDFIYFCKQLDVLPLHGRLNDCSKLRGRWEGSDNILAGSTPAACTSKSLRAQGADDPYITEVDYILAPRDCAASTFRLGPVPDSAPGTHRPVSALITLQALDAGVAAQARRQPKRKLPLPDYGDKLFWDRMATELSKALPQARQKLATGTLEQGLQCVEEVYTLAAKAAQVGGRRANGRKRHQGFRHRFRGRTVPQRIRALFDDARQKRSAYAAARRAWLAAAGSTIPREHTLRRTWQPPADDERLKQLHADCKKANDAARGAAAAHVRRSISVALQSLERQRVSNAHKFAATLQRLTLDSTTSLSGGAIPGDPSVFADHFKQLHQETRSAADIPGIGVNSHKYDACMPMADPALAHLLTSDITADEVAICKDPAHPEMQRLFPMRGHCPAGDHIGCIICNTDKQQLEKWAQKLKERGRLPIPNPRINCRLWGGKAAGSSGLHAEHLRFPRPNWSPEEWRERGMTSYSWRKPANEMLASMFNLWLQHGKVPKSPGFVESVITPIHKKGDPTDPNNYRGIATGNVIPKLFGLVLLRRLTHWCLKTGAIPPNQAGFMPHNSAEGHVFALLETLKARARIKTDTYLLFLDLKKAYDSVSQDALWHVLGKLGVPAAFINLLRDWNSRRPARVKINGDLTDEFLITKGLPQGDVLSPLLFNLFISVLMRRIARDSAYRGVRFPNSALTLKDLWYADDMVGLADSPQQLQYLLDIIREWSADWGIDVGIGQGKTNVMHISAHDGESCDTELKLGDATIGWTDTYRYLGYNLHRTLRNDGFWQQVADRIEFTAGQFVLRHSVARHLSVASQLQVFNTHVLGSITYLLPIVPLSNDDDRSHIDAKVLEALRQILGMHKTCINASVWADTRAMPIDALILQHRLRFRLDLETTPAQHSPAARVLRALQANPPAPASRFTGRGLDYKDSWLQYVHSDAIRFRKETGMDIPEPPNPDVGSTHTYSVGVARMFAYAIGRAQHLARLEVDFTAAYIASPGFLQTSDHNKAKYATHFQLGLHYLSPDDKKSGKHLAASAQGPNKRLQHLLQPSAIVTRLSAWAGGCDGSPIALSTCLSARQCRVIQYFRMGYAALAYWPFNQQFPSAGHAATSGHQSARLRFFGDDANRECPFDGCSEFQHHPLHLATTCKSDVWTGYQRFLRAGVRHLLERMVYALGKAYGDNPPGTFRAACSAVRTQLTTERVALWSERDYAHVVLRLLSCAPFSSYDVRDQMAAQRDTSDRVVRSVVSSQRPQPVTNVAMPLSLAVGQLFDSIQVQRSYLRKWANLWCQWAFKYIMALAGHYNCSRGADRKDVPCYNHRKRRHEPHHAQLHAVDDLGRDAADVDDDSDDDDSPE